MTSTIDESKSPGRHVWSNCLTEEEREVYRRAGYHEAFGLGEKPALLLVDLEYNFTGDINEPILESIEKYPNSCGPNAWVAIPKIASVLAVARQMEIPIVFTHGVAASDNRMPKIGNTIIDQLPREDDDLVVEKKSASAFFGTGVAEHLLSRGVDTVIHVGTTTSGCVRASVVDAAAFGFRNAVVVDCVFDRAISPHRASLFDMDAKYADVISKVEVERYLALTPQRATSPTKDPWLST